MVEAGRVEQQDCKPSHTEHRQDVGDSSGSTPGPRRVSGGVRPVVIDRGRRALRRRRSRPAVGVRRKHAQRPALGRELGSRRPRPGRGRGQHVEVGMSKTVIGTLHRRHSVRPFRGGRRSRWCGSRSESEHGITHAGGSECLVVGAHECVQSQRPGERSAGSRRACLGPLPDDPRGGGDAGQ
jgi:hypothetical protein